MTLKELLQHDRFAQRSGVELLDIQPGYAEARMKITPDHLNAAGVCQGGAIFTLADLVFAAVANSHKYMTLSLTANITFLKSASNGYLYATAHETHNHARIPYIEVRIRNENNEPIAIFQSTGYRKKEQLAIDDI